MKPSAYARGIKPTAQPAAEAMAVILPSPFPMMTFRFLSIIKVSVVALAWMRTKLYFS